MRLISCNLPLQPQFYSRDDEYLKSIHMDEIIPYKRERFEQTMNEVEAAVDLVGGDTLARSYSVVKRGGVLVTTVQPIDESAVRKAGTRGGHLIMKRNAADPADVVALVEKDVLKPRLAQTMSLNEAKKGTGTR